MTIAIRRLAIGPDTIWRVAMGTMRLMLLGASAAGLALMSPAALAAPACNFRTATAVRFGAYNVYAAVANDNGVGSLAVRCRGGKGSFSAMLSTGQSNSYLSRVMTSGANRLNYNLYISAARATVWGDGTGGSSTLAAAGNNTTSWSVFGRIPAGQDVSVGTYADSITATVNF